MIRAIRVIRSPFEFEVWTLNLMIRVYSFELSHIGNHNYELWIKNYELRIELNLTQSTLLCVSFFMLTIDV